MSVAEDIAAVARQEAGLLLSAFDADVAWRLGTLARELAVERGQAIVVDIRRFGQPHEPLFYAATPGTTPDNNRWVERKVNVVARFHRSSYAMGLKLRLEGISFTEKYALPDAEYATHGGCFPLRVAGVGVVGSLTISDCRRGPTMSLPSRCFARSSGSTMAIGSCRKRPPRVDEMFTAAVTRCL